MRHYFRIDLVIESDLLEVDVERHLDDVLDNGDVQEAINSDLPRIEIKSVLAWPIDKEDLILSRDTEEV